MSASVTVTGADGEPLGSWRTHDNGDHEVTDPARENLRAWFLTYAPDALAQAGDDEIKAAHNLLEGARQSINVLWTSLLPIARSIMRICEALGLDVKGIKS